MTKTTTLIALFGILIMQALTTVVYAQTANLESPSSEGVLLGLTNTSHETSKFAKSSNSTAMPGTPLVVPCGLGFSYNTPTCAGSSITLSVGGGTGYYYSWSTHATTQIISDIPKSDGSSVYSVTVTNSTGTCQDIHTTVPIQIIQPTYSITDILASNQLDCTTGNMTFQIQVSNPGNVANLQYSLDGTTWQSSNLFPNKSTDTYQGYVRATSNCTVTYQKFMEEFEPIEFGEIVKSNLGDCVLGNVGVSIQTTGGKVDGYRYRLNGGIWGNVPSYTGLTSGSYYFEAEPINISSGSCSRYMGFTIDETNGVSLTSLQKEQETDCVLANAAITALSNQPAAASVEYRLNAGAWQSSNRFTGLSSGNYTVDIRSTAGCPVAVSTLSTTVAERIYPKLQSIQVLRDRDCTTGNVQLNAVLQDASIAARYRLNGSTWTTTPSFTGLSSGTFTIEVSAPDVSTCSSSLSVTVQELGQVSITSNAVYNITDCVLGNITIEAKHNALTSTGLQFRINGGTWQSSNWFKGLSAGTYTIEGRVVGDAGCTFAIPGNTVTVTEVSGLTVVDTILLSNHTDCTIGNSRIQINLKQATTAQYRLVGVSNWQSSNIFTNRSTGRYIIEVRPTNAACTERDTVDIDEKTAVIGDLAVTGLTDCFHGNLRVEIPVTGTPLSQPFQYRLAGYSTPSAWQNGNVFANFPGFNYNRVEVKTSSGCIFSKSADFFETESIAVDISGLTYLSGATDCIKNNTQVRINTSITAEGTGAAVNLWRINGGAWKWSPDFGPFGRDSIWVEVQATDNTRTCIIGKKILVDEKTPLDIVSLTPSQHDDCTLNNAKIATQISGGQGSIQYKLNTGGFTSSSLFSNLSSARHLITVKDAANCQDTMSIRIAEPPLLQITSTSKANESDCPAGNAQITVNTSGVRGTLTLKVNNGSPLFSNVITNLSTGTYAIVAQDAAGCTANTSVSISELAQLSLSLSKLKEEDCIPGNANIVASTTGARGALSFRLDNGTAQTLGTFLNVPNGPHTVVAQDAAGCSASANLTIAEASQLQLPTPVVQAVNCSGASNGSISLSPTGGSAPYQYTWSNGRSTAVNQNLRAGTYAVTVTDAKGCKVTRSISVNEPTNIGVDLSIIAHSTCHGGSDGVLQSNVGGGSPPYAYTWDNGGTSSTISNLPANGYSLTVTDSHGCTGTASTSISQPASVTVSSTVSNHLDCIQNNVIITANASGGRGNYSYRLDGGALQASGVFSGKTTGAYSLIAQDGAGCNSLPSLININEALPLSLSYSLQNDQDCIAGNVNVIPIPSNAQGAVSYVIAPQGTWDFSTDLQQKGNGTYTLTALDGRNCTASSTVIINEKLPPLPITLPNVQVCSGTTATLNLIGAATNGMSFSWEVPNGATNPGSVRSFNTTVPGTYRVTMTDVNTGCSQTANGNVVHKPLPLVQLALRDTLTCTQSAIILEPPSTVSTSTYNWKTVSGAVLATTAQLRVDSAGTYILKVVDAANCTATDTITVLSYIPSVLQIDTFPSTRCDSANAQIRIQASHPGNWRYRIDSTAAWSNSPVFTGLRAGKYTLSIASPDTACIVDTTITIGSRETCIDLCAGDSLLIGTPGLNPWCMKWLPDAGLSNPDSSYTWVKPQSSTIYRLIITNDDGNIIDSLIYNVTLCPQLSISLATLNLCAQDSALLTASGGTGPYVWKNENGNIVASGATFKPSLPGTYIVEQEGSTALPATIQVSKNTGNNTLSIDAASFALCEDSLLLSARGNYRNLVWKDDQGVVVSNQTDLWVRQAGTYTLQGEIGMGCVEQKSASIVAAPFLISLEQASDTIDIDKYKSVANFYHNLSGTGRQTLGLLTPEGKTTIVELDKGCYDCGTVTIEVRDTLLPDSSLCQKNVKRTWIARNECGRKAMATQTLVVKDQKPPRFIDFPQDSMVVACGDSLPEERPLIIDNLDQSPRVSIVHIDSVARGTCKWLIVRTWEARDTCGNAVSRNQYILVKPPVSFSKAPNPYNCGDNFLLPGNPNQTLVQNLRAQDDFIYLYGFPIQVSSVTGGGGTFSGRGLMTVPFGATPILVDFHNAQVNVDYRILTGSVTAVRDTAFKLPKCEVANKEFCLPAPSNTAENQEELGFKNCEYTKNPPYPGYQVGMPYDKQYDPWGFDCNGTHRETGTKTNPQGCTQEQVQDPNDGNCDNLANSVYTWVKKDTITKGGIALANQVADSIRIQAGVIIAELISKVTVDVAAKIVACTALRGEIRSLIAGLALGEDSTFVVGNGGKYIKEGMWKSFLDKPQKLNLSLDRNASVVSLENKHVDLYTCDQEQEFQKLLLATLKALDNEKGLGELIKQLIAKIQRMPADSVVKYTNSDYLLAWVKTQINAEANHQAQTKLEAAKQAAQPVGFYSKTATDRTKSVLSSSAKMTDQMINAALNHFGEKLATERLDRFKKEFNRGETMIGNTHRAYFLEAILQERALRATLLPPGQADSSEAMLPIRVKNNVEGFDYEIIIDNLTFSPQTGGKLDAFLLLDIPGSSERIVLEGKDIYFTPGGVDFTQNRLELKCDVAVRFMNVAQLKLKGGQTWAKWNCNGFESMNLAAEIQFCRDVLIPLEEGTLEPVVPDSVLLTATFGTAITSWDNFNMNMSFSHPFAIAGMEDFKWKIEGAHLDLSQTRTDADILFPNGYDFNTVSQRASWKGFYMEEFTMYLPKKLSKEGQRTAVSSGQGNFGITARDLIIDDGGVSVNLGIPQRILELNDGNLDGWSFSIDSLTIGITKNHFSKAGFGGLVHVPLFGEATPENSFRYTAVIGLNNLYSFTVQPGASKNVPMWLAKVNLDKSSAITVSSQNGKFTAQAVFNGEITLDGAIGKFAVKTPKMGFKGLKVSNQKPYFDPGVWAAPDSIGAKLGGFDIRIEKLQTVDISEEEKGLRVNVGIKLSPGDGLNLAASGGFLLKGRLDVSSGRQRWLPTGAKLEDFFISGDIKDQLSLSGRMIARDNDPRYGKVFQASLSVKFKCVGPSSVQVDAMGLFGEKDDSKYFMVDVLAQFPGVGGPIQLRGIGGGAYYHMSRADTLVDLSKLATDTSGTAAIALDTLSDLGKSLSGVTYVPNPGISLGIKLAAVLALPEEKAFNANVAIIVQFKTGGGVDEIAFQGMGQFFAPLNFKLKPVKLVGPSPAGTYGTDPPKMSCNVDLRYNFSQKTFHGKLQVFINADSAVIGEGTAEILIAPKKWYIYLGTPQVPIRVRLIVGKTVLAETRAYFDFGNELPPLPDLPSQFRGDAGGSGLFSSALRSRAGGGIIMGFSFFQDLGLKEGSKSPVYAYFTIDLGADMGLVDFGDTYCGNTGKKIGINGWYAFGQAWVYVGAKVGLKIGQKRFDIASLGASAVLQIKAPNPVFGQGAIGGRFSVMGGLVKGKFNLRFKFGSECGVESESGDEESLDQNIRIIAALRPSKDQKNVSPEQLPSADFLMEMDGLTELPGENGEVLSYRVVLEQASLTTSTGTAVNGRILFASDRRSLRFQPFELMPANTDLVFLVKVKYFRNGVFEGTEEAQTTFRTSALPNFINPANISASYPINGMEHLYKDEFGGTGEFIELQQGQAYLFDNVEIGADLYDAGGAQIASVPVRYDAGSKRLLFDLPNVALANGACYTVYIRKKGAQLRNNDNGGSNGGSTDGTLCQLQFCTSQYSTFSQKVSAFFGNASAQTSGYTINLASSAEAFDGKETQWLNLSTFIESESWFQQHIQKIYQAQQTGGQAAVNTSFQFTPTLRNTDWGTIPQGAIMLSDSGRTIVYAVYQAIATDIVDLNRQARDWQDKYIENCMNKQTNQAGGTCNSCCPTPAIITEFMTKTMPAPPLDRYAVILRYVIPGMPGVLSGSYSPLE